MGVLSSKRSTASLQPNQLPNSNDSVVAQTSSNGRKLSGNKKKPRTKRLSSALSDGLFGSDVSGGNPMDDRRESLDLARKAKVILVLRGVPYDGVLSSNTKVVRIFISSTFTDTFVERNALMETTYPRLKKICQSKGYQFQAIDMRWGIRSEATDDHETVELCLQQVKNCCMLSTGPAFFTLLGQKYGYRPLPSRIPEKEFQILLKAIKSNTDVDVVTSWYWMDSNSVPPEYVLQPISSHFLDYTNTTNPDEQREANKAWNKEFERLQSILRAAASSAIKDTALRAKYLVSVTSMEVECGIDNSIDVDETCLWMHRNIVDMRDNLNGDRADKYIDMKNGAIDEEAQTMLATFKKQLMYKKLSSESIREHAVHWQDGGINLEDTEHKEYVAALCGNVFSIMASRIIAAIEAKESHSVNLPCYEEALQHICFAKEKCSSFYGRKDQLQMIQDYLKDDKQVKPLVVHGESGSGKTSVMAQASQLTTEWLGSNSAVIVRFLGTTPASSHIRLLLSSLCHQISFLYDLEYDQTAKKDIKQLKEELSVLLVKVSVLPDAFSPVVIYLDSLDQLSPDDSALQLAWLPKTLPKYVKMIVSTIPGEQYVCLPTLKDLLSEGNFVEVPNMPQSDADQILGNWLKMKARTVTEAQRKMILKAYEKCSLPIFLKVAFDEATRWKSYTDSNDAVLKKSVRGAIESLFERIERDHGKCLVEHTLGYITASKSGLTENELEDILSCDDEVLEDVFQHWVPPIRRIPTLLWIRIRSELSSYLVDRGADGASVVTWYHRQFLEAATDRYLSDEERKVKYSSGIADYFLGLWSGGRRKPYFDRHGNELGADRLATSQPLTFRSDSSQHRAFNERRLSELPHALLAANDLHRLKADCLCNYEYLLALLQARSLRDIGDNFELALEIFPNDPDLKLVLETLHLSSNALGLWPGQLATQLVARLLPDAVKASEYLQRLVDDARRPSSPAFICDKVCLTSPGGPLIHSLSGQKEPSTLLRMMHNTRHLISVSEGGGINVWDTVKGKLARSIEVDGGAILDVVTSSDDRYLAISNGSLIQGWLLATGQPLFSLKYNEDQMRICLTEFFDRSFVVATNHRVLKVIYLDNGTDAYSVDFRNTKSDRDVLVSARGMTAVRVAMDLDYTVAVYNLNSQTVVNTYTLHPSARITSLDVVHDDMILFASVPNNDKSSGDVTRRASVASNMQSIKLNLWQSNDGTPVESWMDKSISVRCHCVTPDTCHVVILGDSMFNEHACTFQARVVMYSLVDRSKQEFLLHYPSTINHIACAGPKRLVTSSLDKNIRIWNLKLLENTATRQSDEATTEFDFDAPIIWSPYLLAFASPASLDGNHVACVYDLTTKERAMITCGNNSEAMFLSDTLLVILCDRELRSYQLPQCTLIHSVEVDVNVAGSDRLYRLSADEFVVVARRRKTFNIFYGPRLVMKKAVGMSKSVDIMKILSGPSSSSFCVCALGSVDETIPMLARGVFVTMYSMASYEETNAIAFSPYISGFQDACVNDRGNYLCDVVYDPYMKEYRAGVWDTGTTKLVFLSDTPSPVHVASLSSSGRMVLCSLWDGSILVYDLLKNVTLWHRACHVGPIHRMFLSSDGHLCLTIAGGFNSKDRSVRLWNTSSGKTITEFTPDVKISAIALASDLCLMALEIQTKLVCFHLVGGVLLPHDDRAKSRAMTSNGMSSRLDTIAGDVKHANEARGMDETDVVTLNTRL